MPARIPEEEQAAGKKLVEFFCVEKAQEMSDLLDMALPFSKVDVSYDNPLVPPLRAILQMEQYPVPMLSAACFRLISGLRMELLCSSI